MSVEFFVQRFDYAIDSFCKRTTIKGCFFIFCAVIPIEPA